MTEVNLNANKSHTTWEISILAYIDYGTKLESNLDLKCIFFFIYLFPRLTHNAQVGSISCNPLLDGSVTLSHLAVFVSAEFCYTRIIDK